MDKLAIAIAAAFGFAALVFVLVILGTFLGGVAGWAVGLVFNDTLALLKDALGLEQLSNFQLGAALGFVGGFFRATVTK